jgi:ER-bound oxygenase mpaB/B'/Rubber oxygenase, catalytic domain
MMATMSSVPNPVPSSTASWTAETLQPLRDMGDPLADAVIAELFSDGGLQAMNTLMAGFVANEHPVPENLPAPVRNYLLKSVELPAWADAELIHAAEDVFWRFGPRIILVLTCYSLPFCYLGRNGVPVLAMTNRLSSNPRRRILETAQMVVDCMSAGGLTTPNGRARLTIQKVRLMHAAIRRLAPTSPSWKPEYGLPVNQEDLAGTLMAFSHITLDGLQKLGIELTDRDRQAYIHCWNVIGHILGVQDNLLPPDPAAARALADAIAAHQFGPTEEAKDLTKALVDMLSHILPGDVFNPLPKILLRFFLGNEQAEWLGIQQSHIAELAVQPIRFLGVTFGDVLEDRKSMAALAETAGKLLIGAIMLVQRGGDRPSFQIPTDLRQVWGVNWTS